MSVSQTPRDSLIPELGFAAGFALWGFRGCALGFSKCCVLARGYERELGAQATDALNGLLVLAQIIGHDGRRKVKLGFPGCIAATPDELSLVAALSAAQSGQDHLADAHLTWLLARIPSETAKTAVARIAEAFLKAGLIITPPDDVSISVPDISHPAFGGRLVLHEGGRA